ncbi:MAG: DUF3131 domain-containing protein [Alphaproteobacteria bacterium]|nr:DUF3131 domain-containing protein [Alphaproteobacteria bacterium]
MQAFAVTKRYLSTRAAPSSAEAVAANMRSTTPTRLSPVDKKHARTAWAYFDRFTDPGRGFCPATRPVDARPSASSTKGSLGAWEMGATLQAILSAGRLDLISWDDMRARIGVCLHSLASLRLSAQHLPGLSYCNATLRPLDQTAANPTSGCSARQIMRLVAGFITVAHHCPDLAPEISLILNGWDLDRLLNRGSFLPARPSQNTAAPAPPDEYLGYEQYAAKVACLVGLAAEPALNLDPILGWSSDTTAQNLPHDRRQNRRTQPIITSDPFHLEAMEFGWRHDMLDVAASLFLAQKARFETTGQLTALTEDALDQPPGFAVQGLLAPRSPYVSRAQNGTDLSQLKCLSTKAAFGWWALAPSPYGQKLLDAVGDLQTRNGWQAGIYERSGQPNSVLSLNTNAVVLEALHYKSNGPLFAALDP